MNKKHHSTQNLHSPTFLTMYLSLAPWKLLGKMDIDTYDSPGMNGLNVFMLET